MICYIINASKRNAPDYKPVKAAQKLNVPKVLHSVAGSHIEEQEFHYFIELNSFTALKTLYNVVEDDLIITFNNAGELFIIIYDDYVE